MVSPRDGRAGRATDAPWREEAHAEGGGRPDARWRRPRVIALLLVGVLAAPLAFMVDLTASFALVERMCERRGSGPLWGITAVAAAIAVAGLLVAWRQWRAVGVDPEPRGEGSEQRSPRSTGHALADELRTDAPGPPGRSRFLALGGVALSAFFLAIVLATVIPSLVLGPCS